MRQHDRDQAERIDLRTAGPAGFRIDLLELVPGPALILRRFDLLSLERALDEGLLEGDDPVG